MQRFPFTRILIACVIGLLGYLAIRFTAPGALDFTFAAADLLPLGLVVGTSLAAAFLAGGSSVRAYRASSAGAPAHDDGYDDDRETGTVKWFNIRKGYGFITRDQGEDVFVHYRSIESRDKRGIAEGQRVSFIVTMGQKGEQADRVNAL